MKIPRHGTLSEARVSKKIGGRLTPASGAMEGAKGDFNLDVNEDYLFKMECKATNSKSMSLKYEWLCKIRNEALETNRIPALTISFVDPKGRAVPNGDHVVIPLWLFTELIGKQ